MISQIIDSVTKLLVVFMLCYSFMYMADKMFQYSALIRLSEPVEQVGGKCVRVIDKSWQG